MLFHIVLLPDVPESWHLRMSVCYAVLYRFSTSFAFLRDYTITLHLLVLPNENRAQEDSEAAHKNTHSCTNPHALSEVRLFTVGKDVRALLHVRYFSLWLGKILTSSGPHCPIVARIT